MLNAWEMPDCAIPEDIVLISNMTKNTNLTVVQRVLDLCFDRVGGVGYIPREPIDLRAELARADRLREQKQQAGRRSAQERRDKLGTAQPSNGRSNVRPNECSAASNAGAGAGAEDGANGRKEAVQENKQDTKHAGGFLDGEETGGRCESCGVYLPPPWACSNVGATVCDDCLMLSDERSTPPNSAS
jgi:hypothetical protein